MSRKGDKMRGLLGAATLLAAILVSFASNAVGAQGRVPSARAQAGKPLNAPVPVPGRATRTFPETGKTVTGIFLDYWSEHGGLAQQGYPISDVIGEVSDLDGKLYTMQYFERAVFEYHPENNPPYNILLSQLGTFQYKKKYPNGAPGQRVNKDYPRFFPETGHTIGGSFREYWEKNGGLMQQGYPISDEFTEVSDLDGRPYTVQYFERAVFEYHPENQPPYKVLLSQLGNYRYDTLYGGAPVLIASNVAGSPVAGGHYLVWQHRGQQTNDIYGYDVSVGRQFLVAGDLGPIEGIATDGRVVAWIDGDVEAGNNNIVGYDLETGRQFPIILSTPDNPRRFGALAVDNGTLYYQDASWPQHVGLYAHDLATGEEHLVTDWGRNPVAADGILLWSDERPLGTPTPTPEPSPESVSPLLIYPNQPPEPNPVECSLHVLKAGTTADAQIIATESAPYPGDCDFYGYHVSGQNVVWSSWPSLTSSGRVGLYNIPTGSKTLLEGVNSQNPLIGGSKLIWTDVRRPPFPNPNPGKEDKTTIRVRDINTGVTTTLLTNDDPSTETQALVGQTIVAFTRGDSYSGEQLYITGLEGSR